MHDLCRSSGLTKLRRKTVGLFWNRVSGKLSHLSRDITHIVSWNQVCRSSRHEPDIVSWHLLDEEQMHSLTHESSRSENDEQYWGQRSFGHRVDLLLSVIRRQSWQNAKVMACRHLRIILQRLQDLIAHTDLLLMMMPPVKSVNEDYMRKSSFLDLKLCRKIKIWWSFFSIDILCKSSRPSWLAVNH